jgi:PhzF family phenazine biosynthesis protein
MTDAPQVLRYAAFTEDPAGGNPAGVVLEASGLSEARMQAIAAEVGFSETAFLWPDADGPVPGRSYRIRYFSPLAEVPFCGHATIATAVALAERHGPGERVLRTMNGPVPVTTRRDDQDRLTATLTSVPPHVEQVDAADVDEVLAALRWRRDDLDPALPPAVGYVGGYYLVLPVRTRERLADLAYDFDRLGAIMAARSWTTIQLVWREDRLRFHSRNPFPPGGVVEDPATGAAAAALGAYLREREVVEPPATVTVLQGEDMGRPGRLLVDLHADRPEIDVTGTAVALG